jgi:two-component system, sensor histidine kinase and response regulator
MMHQQDETGDMTGSRADKKLDLDVALSHVDGDMQLLAELATLFLQDYPRLRGELRSSISTGDSPSLERAAHTLKGRLAFFGIHKAREQALGLELLGRNQNLVYAAPALAEIEVELESILPEFESLSREQNT